MSPKVVIALSGRIGAGKDTSFELIQQMCNRADLTVERFAFADALKRAGQSIYRGTDDHWWGSKKVAPLPGWDGLTARRVMQVFGTEVCQSIHRLTWVRKTFHEIERASCDIAMVTDCRFPHELHALRSEQLGIPVVTVLIKRPAPTAWGRLSQWCAAQKHASERLMHSRAMRPYYDCEITNDSTKTVLAAELATMMMERVVPFIPSMTATARR